MGFPTRLLREGEEVVLTIRPHWWYLAGPVAVSSLVIAGSLTAAVEGVPSWADWVAVGALVLAMLWLVGRYLRWATNLLVLTTTRLIDQRGIIARRRREIPLVSLTDISFRQSIFQRLIGAGNVLLESAGKESQEVFQDLPRPAQVHNEIYQQMDLARAASRVPSAAGPVMSIPEQIEQLARLRQLGIISESEFQSKKAQLLDRL